MTSPNRSPRRPRPRRRSCAPSPLPAAVYATAAGIAVGVAASVAGTPGVGRAAGLAAIRLSAQRTVLRADGRTTTVLSAQVYDERGAPVPDGTQVRFTTTAGRLDAAVVATRAGVARVTLTAAEQPGEARVVALLDTPGSAVPTTLTITFSTDADAADTGASWARIDGDAVGYILAAKTLQAGGKNGGARLSYRGLTLSADTIQLSAETNQAIAVGNVKLERAGVTRAYRSLTWDVLGGLGIGERIDADGLPRVLAVKATGATTPLEEAAPPPEMGEVPRETWELADLSEANITVVARSISLEPNRRLQFRRATFWIDGQKTATLPFHVLDLQQGTLFQDQIVGLGPTGIAVDLPFYYDVRPGSVGTLHMRRGASVGSSAYAARPVWTLDAVQTYNAGSGSEGALEVFGITRDDWGARLRHDQRLGAGTSGNLLVEMPTTQSVFASLQLAREFKTFRVDLSGAGSRSNEVFDAETQTTGQAGGDVRGQASISTYARTLWGVRALQYRLTGDIGRQGFYGPSSSVSQGVVTTRTAGAAIDSASLPVARSTRFRQSLSFGRTWVSTSAGGGSSASGLSLRGTSTLDRSLGRLGVASLAYDYTQAPALGNLGATYGGAAGAGANARHRVGLSSLLSSGAAWSLRLNASRGLDLEQSTLLADFRVRLGGPWGGGASLTQNHLSSFTYREIQYSLSRRIGPRDYTVSYSTTAKRFFFNFAGASF